MSIATPMPGSPSPVRHALRSRPLDSSIDPALFSRVTFGQQPWAVEVEQFLRGKAVMLEEHGVCATTVFQLPTEEEIVGFYATRGIKLKVDDAFREAFDISKTKARKMPPEFDACYLTAFGINVPYQRRGYSPEIHLHLVESLTTAAMRPPYIFLKCWADNPAVWLYHDWEYKTIHEERVVRSTDGREEVRFWMALKVRD